MTKSDKEIQAKIYDWLSKLTIIYEKKPSQNQLTAYCSVLKAYPLDDVLTAIKKAQIECFEFPSLAKLVNLMTDFETLDHEVYKSVGNILYAQSHYDLETAKRNLSELEWEAISCFGGWSSLLGVQNRGLMSARAQLRDILKSLLKKQKIDFKNLSLPNHGQVQLIEGEKND